MKNLGYFVTGTDTGVGKTLFAAYLTKCGKNPLLETCSVRKTH